MNVGMVFAIIFAMIMIAMILVFGIGQIGNVFCLSSDAQVAGSIRDLEAMVEEVYVMSEGSSRVFDVRLPGGSQLCFVDPQDPGTNQFAGQEAVHNWIADPAYEAIIEDYGYNLWYTQCSGKSGYQFEHLQVSGRGSFCVDGGDSLYLANRGRYVEVDFR